MAQLVKVLSIVQRYDSHINTYRTYEDTQIKYANARVVDVQGHIFDIYTQDIHMNIGDEIEIEKSKSQIYRETMYDIVKNHTQLAIIQQFVKTKSI